MIAFESRISIGYLNIEQMDFTRINNVGSNNPIYKNIEPPFDWYRHGNIMIIPDPIAFPGENWNKEISVGGQEIECFGKFVTFFNFKEDQDKYYLATSLTLPEFEHIKRELCID